MNVLVVGGGPAGMMAAATAALGGHHVLLLDKNEKLGKKLYLTGKGRCNLTNALGRDSFFAHVLQNPRFLYSAYSACPAEDIMELYERLHVPLKVERGGRVFPQSDKSSDILRAMSKYVADCGATIRLHSAVKHILTADGHVTGVKLQTGETIDADAIILATGGASYPSTGSTGDGHAFVKALGHTVSPLRPALIPLQTAEQWPGSLAGLALKNVRLRVEQNGRIVYDELGEMLFAHFGVTGPLVLSASSRIADAVAGTLLQIDLKPGLDEAQLDQRLLRDISMGQQMSVKNAFAKLAPKRLLPVLFEQAGIDGESQAASFSASSRNALLHTLKALPLTVSATRPLAEAIITRGGISVNEVSSSTLESKRVRNLYFAGELLDVDAETGGYNLQIAWSTGMLAGMLKAAK